MLVDTPPGIGKVMLAVYSQAYSLEAKSLLSVKADCGHSVSLIPRSYVKGLTRAEV